MLSIQIAFIFGALWLLRKPLSRIASAKYILRFLCSYSVLYYLSRPTYWDMFDLRGFYKTVFGWKIEPLIRIYIPPRITSQIAEISSTHAYDWLGICTFLWLFIAFTCKGPNYKNERFTRSLIHKKYHLECPARIRTILDNILANDERWLYFSGGAHQERQIKLVWIRALRSPCTFDTETKNPVIALDRIDYTDEELENIFRHELAHITLQHERMLDRLDLLCQFCWFNPLLRLMQKWIQRQVEIDSDDVALERKDITPKERASYARLLVSLAEERHLNGAVLHVSAGAQFIRQRVEGVLNPKVRKLSLPVTILLIILSLHLSLVVAPGESPQSRFLDTEKLLACMGNSYDYVVRGLDPKYKGSNDVSFDDGDWYISIEERNSNGNFWVRGTTDAYTEEENEAAAQYIDQWVASISSLLGEPTVESRANSFGLLIRSSSPRITYHWPVTLSEHANERLWADSSDDVSICMTWSQEYLENVTDGLTGEPIPPHHYHQFYIEIGTAD